MGRGDYLRTFMLTMVFDGSILTPNAPTYDLTGRPHEGDGFDLVVPAAGMGTT